jgi:hypothetical protein
MPATSKYSLLLLVSLLVFSCKDKSPITPEGGERPAQEMAKSVPYVDNVEDSYSFEIGFTFESAVSGKITQLGGRLAQVGVSKVSIWDFDTKQKLDSVNVTIKDVLKFEYLPIDPITVAPGKKFVVSINTFPQRDYYVFNALGDYDILPRTFGNITILEKRSNEDGNFAFPERPTKKNFNGWADVVFFAD